MLTEVQVVFLLHKLWVPLEMHLGDRWAVVPSAAQLDQLAQGIAGLARGKLQPGVPVGGSFASS